MKKQHLILSFLALIFFGLFTYYIVHFGYYPALAVNGRWISVSRLNREIQATYAYWLRQAEARGMTPNPATLGAEVRRLALERLIEGTLVHNALGARLGANADARVAQKISEAITAELSSAAKALYGWDRETLRNLVLAPQAEIDVLREELARGGGEYDSWLAAEKAAASVNIFFAPYHWDGEKIVER